MASKASMCEGVRKNGQLKKGWTWARQGLPGCPGKAKGSSKKSKPAKKSSAKKNRKKCQKANGQLKKGWTYGKNGACKKASGKSKTSKATGKSLVKKCAGLKSGKRGRPALKKGYTWKKKTKTGCPTKVTAKKSTAKKRRFKVAAHSPRRHRHTIRVGGRAVKTSRARVGRR